MMLGSLLAQVPTAEPFEPTAAPTLLDGATSELLTPSVTWAALAPLLVLAIGALLLLTFSSLAKGRVGRGVYTLWTVVTAVVALVVCIPLWARVQGWDAFAWWDPATTPAGPFSTLGGAAGVDGFSIMLTMLIAVAVIIVTLVADDYAEREGIEGPELFVLVLLSASGGVVMAMANDLIVLFLGLETLSIAVYVLAAIDLKRSQSQEAGFKYFILGAFSSAFFLYGIAMVYGGTGTTSLLGIKDFLSEKLLLDGSGLLVLLGIGLLLVGFGFKIAAVPFHSWSPDVYDGAPSPVVAFMASVVKVAAFAGLVRVLVVAMETQAADWKPVISALAVLSLFGGAVAAIVQTNVKRLLAYSSISHAGFMLLGIQAAGPEGTQAVVIYLIAYTFMVIGSFAVVTLVAGTGDDRHDVADYKGLATTNPALAATFTLFLLAQAGVPFTAGFYAKFFTIVAAVNANAEWLAVIAMLSAVIGAYLYLRLVITIWFVSGDESDRTKVRVPFGAGLALVACAVVTLWMGVFPDTVTALAEKAVPVLVQPESPVAAPTDAGLLGGANPGLSGG